MSFSNTPISRVNRQNYRVDHDFGGIAWNDQVGYFFPGEADALPLKEPYPATRRPPTQGRRRRS